MPEHYREEWLMAVVERRWPNVESRGYPPKAQLCSRTRARSWCSASPRKSGGRCVEPFPETLLGLMRLSGVRGFPAPSLGDRRFRPPNCGLVSHGREERARRR